MRPGAPRGARRRPAQHADPPGDRGPRPTAGTREAPPRRLSGRLHRRVLQLV